MTVRGYTLAFDWSGYGQYNGPNEDLTSRVQKGELVISMGRDSEATAGAMTSGDLEASLNNRDRLLSPENAASALTGRIRPGRRVKFTAQPGATIYNLFEGVGDTYEVATDAARTFTVNALDAWGRPGAEKLSTPLYFGLRTSDAIGVILDRIGWTGGRDIDTGATVMPYWWVEGDDAATAVQNLVNSEGPPAVAYVRGGTFVFRGRHHRLYRAASLTSQALFTHIEPAGTGPAGDLKMDKDSFLLDYGLTELANAATFAVPVRQLRPLEEVWSSDEQVSLVTGETRTVEASSSDPFTDARLSYDLQSGTVSVGLSRTDGASTVITVTAATAAVITRMALVAQPAPVIRTVRATTEDASAIANDTRATWQGGDPTYANAYDAQAITDHIVAVYANNRPRVTFSVTVAFNDSVRLGKLLALDISDRITVRSDPHGINSDFMIERIVHTITNLTIHKVTIGAQAIDPVQASTALTFGVAGLGFNQGTFAATGIDSPTTAFRFDTSGVGFGQGVFGT